MMTVHSSRSHKLETSGAPNCGKVLVTSLLMLYESQKAPEMNHCGDIGTGTPKYAALYSLRHRRVVFRYWRATSLFT